MTHPDRLALEKALHTISDRTDDALEDTFGDTYNLHPNRMRRGKTENKASDGLFNAGFTFTPGYGSTHGRGYVLQFHISTLERVPKSVFRELEDFAAAYIESILNDYFLQGSVELVREETHYKLVGNFVEGIKSTTQ